MPPTATPEGEGISSWLAAGPLGEAENGASVQPITERPRPGDLLATLATELQDTRFPDDLFIECAEILGMEYSEELVSSVTPTNAKMRRGYFGEMIAACCLRDFDGCWIAVQKPSFAITANQSLPGTDVLAAFVNDGEIQNLVFVEAKLRTARERRIVLQAARQAIADSENGHAPMIAFVLRRLHESDDQMFKPFLNYLARRRRGDQDDLPYVYLVLEQDTWSGNDVSVLDDICPLPPGFRVSVVEIGNLAELVRQSYSLIGMGVDEHDDE